MRTDDADFKIESTDFATPIPMLDRTTIEKLEAEAQSQGYELDTIDDKESSDLKAKISRVTIEGTFQVTFSHEIFLVVKESITEKNAVQVRVFWMNEAIINGNEEKPKYTTKVLDVTESYISFRLIFEDPSLVSRGFHSDIVEVHFKRPELFIR